jgi:NAD+ kinase
MAAIGIIVHQDRPNAAELAAEMAGWLEEHGHKVRVPAFDVTGCPSLARWSAADTEFPEGLELLISIGGDGTMLRAVHAAVAPGVPVLGVNLGHLGYLSEVEPGSWREALQRFLDGDFRVEERMTLDVEFHHHGGGATPAVHHHAALNDAVLEKLEAGHTVRLGVSIDGRPFLSYAADGLIVSTPTGSTAYNLSAGGPILSPLVSALVVTPVAPHLLFDRSMVLGPTEEVRLEVVAGRAALSVDGQSLGRLDTGDFLICRAGPHAARLITFGERDVRQILKSKFGLSAW